MMSDLIEQVLRDLQGPYINPLFMIDGQEITRLQTLCLRAQEVLLNAAARIRALEAEKETLHAQLHGMQDGSLVRDQAARISELEAERDEWSKIALRA